MDDSVFDHDCTYTCSSTQHAEQLISAVTKASEDEVITYFQYLCANFPRVVDKFGRSVLHVAASVGKAEIIDFLIEKCNVNVSLKDTESGWTALHRAIYCGQLHAARQLWRVEALTVRDKNGCLPLDLLCENQVSYIDNNMNSLCDVSLWGANDNDSLGSSQQHVKIPEVAEVFRKNKLVVKKAVIQKLHSLFLTNDGKVYSCGHGVGGRLGQNNENTHVSITLVESLKNDICVDIAAGLDHSLFLLKTGQVMSCGQNTYVQLGFSSNAALASSVQKPKNVPLKFTNEPIVGICAGRYHSVFYSATNIYACGLNGGQLGYKTEKMTFEPRKIAMQAQTIKKVVTCDAAMACLSEAGDISVFSDFSIRRIPSRSMKIVDISLAGGALVGVKNDDCEVKVAAVTEYGFIYIYSASDVFPVRYLTSGAFQLHVIDFQLYADGMILVSKEGLVYTATLTAPKNKPDSKHMKNIEKKLRNERHLFDFLDRDQCGLLKLHRVPLLSRVARVTCDPQGARFAAFSCIPTVGVTKVIERDFSEMPVSFYTLLHSSMGSDLTVEVGGRRFEVHRFIMASRCYYFQKILTESGKSCSTITVQGVHPDAFEDILIYIYGNTCRSLVSIGYPNSLNLVMDNASSGVSLNELVKETKKAAKILDLRSLTKRLTSKSQSEQIPRMKFDRKSFPEFHDITLVSSDKVHFAVHRCVLMARMEYFRVMLSCGWAEQQMDVLQFCVPTEIVTSLLDFIYTDDAPRVRSSESPGFICKIMGAADEFFVADLKRLCEVALAELINLKIVCDVLELAYLYNAEQAEEYCMDFICANLIALFEMQAFDVLNDAVMNRLSKYYQKILIGMDRRMLTPYDETLPSREEIRSIHEAYGSMLTKDAFVWSPPAKSAPKKKPTPKRRTQTTDVKPIPTTPESPPIVSQTSPEILEKPPTSVPSPSNKTDVKSPPQQQHVMKPVSKSTWKNALCSPSSKQQPQFRRKQSKSKEIPIPQASSSCPWANINSASAVSPHSPSVSFWDSALSCSMFPPVASSPPEGLPGLKEVIRAEERNYQSKCGNSVEMAKFEEMAIVDLLCAYDANDNADEYVIVRRVVERQPNTICSAPYWCRK